LTYDIPQRRPHTSWRNWGGIQTEAQANEEKARISEALSALKLQADFGLDLLPLASIRTVEQATALTNENYDVVLIYAAGGGGDILEKLVSTKRWNLMFLRHDPGPVYLWYEIVHPRFLRKTVDDYGQPGMDVDDVVVDLHEEVLWRLRALHGLKNTLGKRMIAIGGSGGWGEGGQKAPEIARKLWQMDLVDYPYKDLEPRLKQARADAALVSRCGESPAAIYVSPGSRCTRIATSSPTPSCSPKSCATSWRKQRRTPLRSSIAWAQSWASPKPRPVYRSAS
jgi:hypothetical protein